MGGDVNGDGLDDLISIGAATARGLNNSRTAAGETYVIFGRTTSSDVDLATLGASGVFISGAENP